MSSSTTRFGVIGTGGIASVMTTDITLLPDVEVVAVGSRTEESAARFAREHGVPRAHGSYADLMADPEVDVVYVATPHPGHQEAALLAVEAGKALLVEKPFTMDAAQARTVVDAARARGTFVMEAMWPRFLPHMVRVREILASGALGEIVTVTADHGQWFAFDPQHRLFAPELGGGALLDLGVYPISFASMVLGTPARVSAKAVMGPTGVDAQTSMVFEYDSGAHAVLTTTMRAASPTRAVIVGTEGRIEIDTTWYAPTSFTFHPRQGEPERYAGEKQPREHKGLRYEAAEVARCLREGLTESPVLPLDETVAIMATMDEVRAQIGLTYPGL
ncbi:Gfo/Idh/MocA family protein [Angustibacter sp. McL0619]|uniref:Gfo/Idh/MocA family protein n=1 Tax=Angustibacter sp. McL0619 TaxID=3415676 RepID=UPI003CF51E80